MELNGAYTELYRDYPGMNGAYSEIIQRLYGDEWNLYRVEQVY